MRSTGVCICIKSVQSNSQRHVQAADKLMISIEGHSNFLTNIELMFRQFAFTMVTLPLVGGIKGQ